MKVLFNTFCNQATGILSWVGVEDAEVVFLNDFRWKPLPDMLQLLEGHIAHCWHRDDFCKRDIDLSKDTLVFAPLILIDTGAVDGANTETI